MSTLTTITMRCDRCGHEHVLGDDGACDGWGKVAAAGDGCEFGMFGRADKADDLCASCLASLREWRRDPASHPAPAPPAPPAPPPRPRLNLDDRKRAITFVVEGLKLRTEFAMAIVRQQPTAILDGGIVPGALFGIEDSAEGLVDGVLDQVGFEGYRRAPKQWSAHVLDLATARERG